MNSPDALHSLLTVVQQAIAQPDMAVLLTLRDALSQTLEASSGIGYLAFFTCYVLITALCLPGGSILMLVGGACMNFTGCLLLSNTACTLGAWLTLWMARAGIRRQSGGMSWLERIENGLADHQTAFLISIRLAPVIPFSLFNILAGLSSVRQWPFVWTSFVGMLPGTWLYVNAGAQLGAVSSLDELLSWPVLASVAALAIVPWGISLAADRQPSKQQS